MLDEKTRAARHERRTYARQRGEAFFKKLYRDRPAKGTYIAIDCETGQSVWARTRLAAMQAFKKKFSDSVAWVRRHAA
jgi:hypothetical protein